MLSYTLTATPKSFDRPAEDKGLYKRLPAIAPVVFNMHHFNASGMTILKEPWTNLWWESDATISRRGSSPPLATVTKIRQIHQIHRNHQPRAPGIIRCFRHLALASRLR